MLFGISADAQAKVRVPRLQEGDELVGICEAVRRRLELAGSLRGITAKGHDIPESVGMYGVGNRIQLIPGVPHACEMRHDGVAEVLLQPLTWAVRWRVLPPAP